MRLLGLLFLLTTFTACGSGGGGGTVSPTPTLPTPAVVQNSELVYYINLFKTQYGVNVNYTVQFDSDGETGNQTDLGTTVGVCRVWSDGRREVLVNKNWWDQQADVTRKVLIYHELGHCSFNRSHKSDLDTSVTPNRPRSMMYPVINPIVYWFTRGYQAYYEAELSDPSVTYMTDSEFMTDEDFSEHTTEDMLDHDNGDCVQYLETPASESQP